MSFFDNDSRHGTKAGFEAHKYYHISPCEPCRNAQKAYMREYRRRRVSGSKFTFPLRLGPLAHEMEGLGLTIARAIRESA